MNTPKLPSDELFKLELRIARRADALTRRFGPDRGHALANWRRAERELLRMFFGASRPRSRVVAGAE